MIEIRNEYIVFSEEGSKEFFVPLKDCDSYAKIVAWAIKLTDAGCRNEDIREFIFAALQYSLSKREIH